MPAETKRRNNDASCIATKAVSSLRDTQGNVVRPASVPPAQASKALFHE